MAKQLSELLAANILDDTDITHVRQGAQDKKATIALVNDRVGTAINRADELTTIADTDLLAVSDASSLFDIAKITWANFKIDIAAYLASLAHTLTNKTIALGSNTVSGTTAQFNTALTDGDFATLAGSETLTNKTIALGSNTVSGTIAQFNTAVTDADFATLAGSETLTNKTLTNPTINAGSGVVVLPQTATPAQTAEGSIVWDTDDLLTVGTGAGRKTMCDTDSSQTLTNKTLTSPVIGTGLELGHASDTTFTRIAAGRAALEGQELIKEVTNQAIVLGNDFDGGDAVQLVALKVSGGTLVQLMSGESFGHTSKSNPSSTPGIVPAAYRPPGVVDTTIVRASSGVTSLSVTGSGTFSINYRDWAGVLTAQNSTGAGFSLQWYVAD